MTAGVLKKNVSVWERGGAFAQQLAQHFIVIPRDTGLGEPRYVTTLPHDLFGIVNNCF
jgi:hypothetical protein